MRTFKGNLIHIATGNKVWGVALEKNRVPKIIPDSEVDQEIRWAAVNFNDEPDPTFTICPVTLTWDEPKDDSQVCFCPCHTPGEEMMHCQPCCGGQCMKCGRHIKDEFWDEHNKTCEDYSNAKVIYEDWVKRGEKIKELEGKVNFQAAVLKAKK